ncbi:MAG: hypothetical protein HYR96_10525 [Deltaproteobacteria bacterium]|nr:hypothetical protein [Deltaproteobacteria bacterium]MBI3293562.1 hypothetical protein [Deltaproteobacteria bacterium]
MEWVSNRPKLRAAIVMMSFLLSLPPISWAPAMIVFAVFSVLWIAITPVPTQSLMIGLGLSLSFALTEVLLTPNLTLHLGALSHPGTSLVQFTIAFASCLHLPIFFTLATWVHHRFHIRRRMPLFVESYFAIGLPALFVVCESIIPRPIGWKLGHAVYSVSWILQGSEFAGVEYLSFAVFGMSSLLALLLMPNRLRFPDAHPILAIVALLYWIVPVLGMRSAETARSEILLYKTTMPKMLQLGIIGREASLTQNRDGALLVSRTSSECEAAFPEINDLVEKTEILGRDSIKRDIIFWPMVKDKDAGLKELCHGPIEEWADRIQTSVVFPVGTGPTTQFVSIIHGKQTLHIARHDNEEAGRSFRFLASVVESPNLQLASSLLPSQISQARTILLSTGERLGVTFDTELLSNASTKTAIEDGVYALVNLGGAPNWGMRTDYWVRAFDTARSIEYRIPSIRVDSNGRSFIVDSTGANLADDFDSGAPHSIKRAVTLPMAPPLTYYASMSSWFILVCMGILATYAFLIFRRKTQPIPLYVREAQRRQQAIEMNARTPLPRSDDSK